LTVQKRNSLLKFIVTALSILAVAGIGYRVYRITSAPRIERVYQAGLQSLAVGDLGSTMLAAEALSAGGIDPNYKLLLEGAIDLRMGRLQLAALKLEEPMKFAATSAMAQTLTGELLYKTRQFSAAIQVLRQAVKADETQVDAHRWLAAALYDIGATGPTIKELAIVSKLDLEDPRPHRLTGLIYKDMESYEAAIGEYREALRRSRNSPDGSTIRLELAECLFQAGKYEELEKILEECPLNAATRTLAAHSQHVRGDSEKALKLVGQAIAMDPKHLPAMLLKATIQLEQAQVNEAVITLRAAVADNPLDHRVHFKLSQALAKKGDIAESEKYAAESTRLRDLRAHFADLHSQASEDVGNAAIRYQLGVTAEQLGLIELANSWFSAALTLDPNHAEAQAALTELRRKFTETRVNAAEKQNDPAVSSKDEKNSTISN
jgi:superkiller protein 3